MAAIFADAVEGLVRTSGLVAASSNYSFCGWFYTAGASLVPGSFQTFVYLGDDPASFTSYLYIAQRDTTFGGVIMLEIAGPGPGVTPGPALTVGWHFLAYTYNAATFLHTLYVDGVVGATATADVSTAARTHLFAGTDTYANDWQPGKLAYWRVWNATLTATEIRAEGISMSPVRAANLWTDTPLESDLLDDSGNGRDWAESGGTITFDAQPTLPTLPTNLTALTAIDLGTLPASVSQDVHVLGVNFTVWYRYTAVAREHVIGVFGFGALTGYQPTILVYVGPAAAPVAWLGISAINKPVQLPVVEGVTYYFEFNRNVNTAPAILLIEAETAPRLTIPANTLFINDDTTGFPGAFVDSTTGTVRNFVYPFPNGEAGDILPSGISLFEDDGADQNLKLYDPQFNLLIEVPFVWVSAPRIRSANAAGRFYVGSTGLGATVAYATTVSNAGVLGATNFTFPTAGLTGLAANNAETILYFSGQGSSVNAAIKRWDLVLNSALADLVGGVADHVTGDMLVLGDDTLVVLYFDSTPPRSLQVRRYDAAGTLLNTYTFGSTTMSPNLPRLAYAIDDPLSFWIWFHANATTAIGTFQNVRVSDGAILTSVTSVDYEGGVYQPPATATPLARFGNSFSCPFILTRAAITTDNEPEPPDDVPPIFIGETPMGGEGCPNDLAPPPDSGGGQGCAAQMAPSAGGGTPEPPGPIPSLLIPRGPQQFQHRAERRIPIRAFQAPPPPFIAPEALPIGRRAIAKPAQRMLQRSWIHAYTPPLVPDPLPIGQHSFVAPATRTATRPYIFFVIPPTIAASDFPVGRPSAITYAQQPRHWFRRGRRSRIEYYALGAS